MIDQLREDLEWFIDYMSDASDELRLMKIGEELGEAIEAFIGMHGHNPRKGVTNDEEKVATEVADIAVTALIALGDYTNDPIAATVERMRFVRERAQEALDALAVDCTNCDGTGRNTGWPHTTCPVCSGTGTVPEEEG